jgi:ribosomal protein S18 acetylase RimI-like enzyme
MTVEIAPLDLGASGVAEAVVTLQRASYRVEADILGARTLPVLRESPRKLRRTREQFLGAFEGERLVGAVSWKRNGTLVDIHRLVVHPERFRRGIAHALLDALEALQSDAERWTVATGAVNEPARHLYERHGFRPVAEQLVDGSITIVTYERRASSA